MARSALGLIAVYNSQPSEVKQARDVDMFETH